MKTYEELKAFCDEKIKQFPQYLSTYKREISAAKRFYDNDRNLYQELVDKKEKIDKRYIIPFLLELTNEVNGKNPELIQVKFGEFSLPDVDSDWSAEGKVKIQDHLREKYGDECFAHVGTYSLLGPASASSDLLRIYNIDFKESKSFTALLQKELSWEENINTLKELYPVQYKFYLDHKSVLDLVPYFIGKIRQVGTHAGGVVITPEPIWKYIPVNRVNGEVATAFPESGNEAILESLGLVKIDILGIRILDVIEQTIDMINEKLYLVEEDGIQKIVPQSYLDKEISKF
jgi:hypothetical protein